MERGVENGCMSKTLYIKIEQCIQVKNLSVKIGDVAAMECSDPSIVNRLKTEKLLKIDDNRKKRTVVSTMLVIKKIHEIYPELEIQSIGESDFILQLPPEKTSKFMEAAKVTGVCLISFFGSVFAMMTFNEDVSTLGSFQKVYTWVMGQPPQGATILELCYSLGISVGIILFFNHFGKKRLTKEPSPVEVEMSDYDQQVYTTLIQHAGRKGLQKDVD